MTWGYVLIKEEAGHAGSERNQLQREGWTGAQREAEMNILPGGVGSEQLSRVQVGAPAPGFRLRWGRAFWETLPPPHAW